jgi:hypothetical protein
MLMDTRWIEKPAHPARTNSQFLEIAPWIVLSLLITAAHILASVYLGIAAPEIGL